MNPVRPAGMVRELWPLLIVRDLGRSVAFYRDRLGFEVAADARSEGAVFWCRMKRDGCSLMLQQAESEDGPADHRGRGVVFYFLCDDADVMHAELVSRGLPLSGPTTAYYGMRQVAVQEPDGYSLCFESPARGA